MTSKKSMKSSEKTVKTVHSTSETLAQKSPPGHLTVVHNHKMATPIDDFTLYPDDVVIVKHSSIRPRKVQNVCLKQHSEEGAFDIAMKGPLMPPSPPNSNPGTQTYESRAYRDRRSTIDTSHDSQLRPTVEKSKPRAAKTPKTEMMTTHPCRLPTPDISDVDKDEFWGCCNGGDPRT